jgi:hypothetical protein
MSKDLSRIFKPLSISPSLFTLPFLTTPINLHPQISIKKSQYLKNKLFPSQQFPNIPKPTTSCTPSCFPSPHIISNRLDTSDYQEQNMFPSKKSCSIIF